MLLLRAFLFGLVIVTTGLSSAQNQGTKGTSLLQEDPISQRIKYLRAKGYHNEADFLELWREVMKVWGKEQLQELWQRLPDRELFCRRLLLLKQQELYRKILDFARNEKKYHWWFRDSVLHWLKPVPHVILVEPLIELIQRVPWEIQKHPDWADKYGAQVYWRPQLTAMQLLATIPDPRVVDFLREFVERGHPNPKIKGTMIKIKGTMMEWLMRIEACVQFCLLVGQLEWAIEVGQSRVAEEPMELRKKLLGEFESWVKRIGQWWKENRGKVKIRWERAGMPSEALGVIPPGYVPKEP